MRCSISPSVFQADPTKSEMWNRGAYLVEGLGHCGACHSPRNALGAEKQSAYLAGGFAEGWEAPALTSLSQAPIPWSEDELYAYLADRRIPLSRRRRRADGAGGEGTGRPARSGYPRHGGLSRLVQRRRHRQAGAAGARRQTRSRDQHHDRRPPPVVGARLYQGACAVCHEVGGAPLFGSRPSLALNSNLHSAVPDNLIQVILHGIAKPVSSDLGYMPAFKDSLTDGQVAELASYLRQQFAPDQAGLDRYRGRRRPDPAGMPR